MSAAREKEVIALCSGSFDPATLGHVDIFRRALALADRLIIVIGAHASKQALLSPQARCDLLEAICAEWPEAKGRVEARLHGGLIADCARETGASLIIRGVRNASDYDYEAGMAAMNRTLNPECDTVFLAASGEYAGVSSTLVRQIFSMGGDIRSFVPAPVLQALEAKRG